MEFLVCMLPTNTQMLTYWLDKNDVIQKVCVAWDQFAQANDGQATLAEQVIGKRLWNFIDGSNTRLWLDAVLTYARISGSIVEKRYRCDSPTEKRFMLMRVIPHTADLLEVQCNLEQELPQQVCVQFEAKTRRIPSLKVRCSICNRIKINADTWQEADTAVLNGSLDNTKPVKVIYGVCAACQAAIKTLHSPTSRTG
jgi:hypothetical protein